MYCPRCNNTHWLIARPRDWLDRLAILRLKRPYRCIKCERVRLGYIFLDFRTSRPRKREKKQHESILKCPWCGGVVRRTHRKALERLLFFVRAYRCIECQARFRTFKVG
jgi:DNA-directed RNA polymerase subunit RPC12/RpoP